MSTTSGGGLRVSVLGPVRAWLGEDELSLGPARQRAVLALLAARANRVVSRHELVDGLWGDAPPASAVGSLHTYVSGLRRALGPVRDTLVSQTSGYSLRLADGAVDADVFDRSRSRARLLVASGDHHAARVALDEALGLWLGEAYSGVPGPFAEVERRRLDELRLSALEMRARAALELGAHREVVAELTGLVGEHPWHESLWEVLMLALDRSGRHAEALEAFRDARRALVDEQGVEPGPALRDLHQRIVTGTPEPPRRTPEPPRPPAGSEPAREPRSAGESRSAGGSWSVVGSEPMGGSWPVVGSDSAGGSAPVGRPEPARPSRPGGAHAPRRLFSVPPHVARVLRDGVGSEAFVGRVEETALLRDLVTEVLAGRGAPVWVEGEAGIGKSELLTVALADAARRGCQVGWAVADEPGRRFPLQVIMDCLDVSPTSPDRHRAEPAVRLRSEPAHGGWGPSDPVPVAVDRLLALVDRVCASGPLLLVIDDLHWADEASVLMWHRLAAATRQLPLLLVAATRPDPGRRELAQLRRGVESRRGHVVLLEPLAERETEELIGKVVGARPDDVLREVARRTAGNPLYTREVAHALVRNRAVRVVGGVAAVDRAAIDQVPSSLLGAVDRTLDSVSPATRDVLRSAALLGAAFGVDALCAVTGRSALDLVGVLDEAVSATVLVEAGDELAFRHPYLRQALYEGISRPVRAALHRHAAEALAGIGAPVERVAEHLAAEPVPPDEWVVGWLARHHATVANRAPLIAVDLLRQAVGSALPTRPQRASLLTALVKVLFRLERNPEHEAEQALELSADPDDRAEMRHLLAAMRHRRGDTASAIAALRQGLDVPDLPEIWRTRHLSLLANFRRGDLADLDEAERTARQVRAESVAEGEPYPVAHASQTLWLIDSIRRDHERALRHVDDALATVGDRTDLAELRFDLLDNKVFTLQNLDRLAEAERALASARLVAARHDLPTGLQVSTAVHHYWTGRWDEALVELDTVTEDGPAITFFGMREPGPAALLLHGVAALIAGRRDDRAAAAAHLRAAESHAPATSAERESCDFYLVAAALAAEQRGAPDEALRLLAPVLRPDFARMMLRHQWLPHAARLALDSGDREVARTALEVCEEEAAKEVRPARAHAAAAHCRGLVRGDPRSVLTAAAHYRLVGRPLELASALVDAGVLLARGAGSPDEVTAAFGEALELFDVLSARWDVRRAERLMRASGVRGDAPHAAGRPRSGWQALSPLEVRIARLVAEGLSNPDIAGELALSRRTVQSHVSRVLDKLRSPSRTAVAEHVDANRPSPVCP
ncbi:BTAD domain-containing putative transcriptional regulator [Saccharothrix xinjiangensis]|uniref:BTAD domain-containing putative transcriptional regulator n=1 Tax=Saccharothrix xinjiangensis TaxID=204798 RepID=A0ABV9Y6G3_9PSEU